MAQQLALIETVDVGSPANPGTDTTTRIPRPVTSSRRFTASRRAAEPTLSEEQRQVNRRGVAEARRILDASRQRAAKREADATGADRRAA